ncbi:MAG: DNA gyrase C-terminal beta-propeller domain-containing protein, partial [Aestuariivirga sp.]
TSHERTAYIKRSRAALGEQTENAGDEEVVAEGFALSNERYEEMAKLEQVILTVSANGYGKRTSTYEYRITNRGGKGITAMAVNDRNGPLVASFPVVAQDDIMLVTDAGQVIRCPVKDIRLAGRSTQGVIVLNAADDEHVVSVERISEDATEVASDEGAVEI